MNGSINCSYGLIKQCIIVLFIDCKTIIIIIIMYIIIYIIILDAILFSIFHHKTKYLVATSFGLQISDKLDEGESFDIGFVLIPHGSIWPIIMPSQAN